MRFLRLFCIFFCLFAATPYALKAQDSLSIIKIEISQLDSGTVKPFYADIPYFFIDNNIRFIINCTNNSRDTIKDLKVTYKLIVKDSLDSIQTLSTRTNSIPDTLNPHDTLSFYSDSLINIFCRGNYQFRTIIESPTNAFIDSVERFLNVSDTTISKDFSNFSSETGPSFYMDTVFNVTGGDTIGDRFGTLFQFLDDTSIIHFTCFNYCNSPTSLSLFVSNDSSNIGITIVPKIWAYNEDSIGNRNEVGRELMSSFFRTTISAADLGKWKSFGFDNGLLTTRDLKAGEKFVAGWETTARLSRSSNLIVALDTGASLLQPFKTSFVFFGHATSNGWMAIEDLPAVRVNFGHHYLRGPHCKFITSTIESKRLDETPVLYPNPVANYFYLETESELEADFQLFNSLGQQFPINYEPTAEGCRFDAAHLPKGIYLLQTNFSDGRVSAQKFIKSE